MKYTKLLLLIIIFCSGCSSIESITCKQKDEYLKEKSTVLVDVRSENEYNITHLDDSINIDVNEIEDKIDDYVKNKNAKIIVYCQSGTRSKKAAQILNDLGYKNVYDLGSINNC